jgi:hypothetical protein
LEEEEPIAEEELDVLALRASLEEARAELEGHREREAHLRSTQASLQARIDGAVMEERRKGRRELSEAQSLLEVAQREQAKTSLQLQRAQRKLGEECARAVEAAELSRRGLEEELAACRDRLRAVQVERNLLLTTLRQEGIRVPPKRTRPRQLPATLTAHTLPRESPQPQAAVGPHISLHIYQLCDTGTASDANCQRIGYCSK